MACAYELARQGAGRVVLFEKQNLVSGTTGGSAGVICMHDMGEIYASLSLVGHARVRQLQRDHGFRFDTWGSLNVYYEPDDVPDVEEDPYQARFGGGEDSLYNYERLEPEELIRRYPWIKAEGVRGGILYGNQGFVDTYELVSLYERLAVETGRVEIRRNTPVLQMRTEGDGVSTVVTRRGQWRVGKVLNAAGPWGAKVAALAGSELALTPQRIQVCVATAFDDGIEGDVPLTGVPDSVDGEGVWCRGELGGTLLFGQHHNTPRPDFTVDPDHVNRDNDPGYPAAVGETYRRYWHLPKSVFLNGWCCVYGMTDDGYPIISRDTRLRNLYHAVGMNGHGMTMHAGVALATAELMLRGGTTLDLGPLIGRPERIDFSVLDAGRFERGDLLDLELHDTVGAARAAAGRTEE
jgi:sarcosine oxidase subunit beta